MYPFMGIEKLSYSFDWIFLGTENVYSLDPRHINRLNFFWFFPFNSSVLMNVCRLQASERDIVYYLFIEDSHPKCSLEVHTFLFKTAGKIIDFSHFHKDFEYICFMSWSFQSVLKDFRLFCAQYSWHDRWSNTLNTEWRIDIRGWSVFSCNTLHNIELILWFFSKFLYRSKFYITPNSFPFYLAGSLWFEIDS